MKKIYLVYLAFACALTACKTPEPKDEWAFTKPAENPILQADSSTIFIDPITRDTVRWQKADVFNPAAIIKNGKVMMLYRAEDNPAASLGGRTSRIGLAESEDGIHFSTHTEPVLFPDSSKYLQYEYPGGCEDPRVVATDDGHYIVTYTAWNGKTARLSVASTSDLSHFTKHGPAFRVAGKKWLDTWSKSGAIVSELKDGSPVAVKINGKYWMYWGDTDIFLASSDDLLNWTPVTDDNGELLKIASPRKGYFDSGIAEPGPPALLTEEGVRLIYNGKNADDSTVSDTAFAPGMYGAGTILFNANDLTKILRRDKKPFLYPTLPHEKTGQYQAGTTFAEAYLVYKGKRYLYYGTADSFVGVAVADE